MKFQVPTFCFLLLFCISCKKDNIKFAGTTIIITESIDTLNAFFAVNNSSTGELLFHSSLIEGIYEIPHDDDIEVDVTAGRFAPNSSYLATYRGIDSPYNLTEQGSNSCFSKPRGPLIPFGQNYEIRIAGINSYEELYLPFVEDDEVEAVFIEDNSLVIQGKIYHKNRLHFTVKLDSNDEYQTYTINFADWSTMDNTLRKEIGVENFTVLSFVDISFGDNSTQRITLTASISEDDYVTLSAAGEYHSWQENNFVRVFYSPNYYDFFFNAFTYGNDGVTKLLDNHYDNFEEVPQPWSPQWDTIQTLQDGLIFPTFDDADEVMISCTFRENFSSFLNWEVYRNVNKPSHFYYPELPLEVIENANGHLSFPINSIYIKAEKFFENEYSDTDYCPDKVTCSYHQ
ncbi:MAG: hypothetical protein ACI85O_002841 [Saprospiraceae bacterium]|jgi:hypothetical protein